MLIKVKVRREAPAEGAANGPFHVRSGTASLGSAGRGALWAALRRRQAEAQPVELLFSLSLSQAAALHAVKGGPP